ncbi:hypothetical protein V6N13_040663 [Hibiscus sabdariffa]
MVCISLRLRRRCRNLLHNMLSPMHHLRPNSGNGGRRKELEKLRAKFGLPAEPCNDCCLHFWCEPCALCQEHAELKNRGFDPSKGWNDGTHIAPPRMPPSMKR